MAAWRSKSHADAGAATEVSDRMAKAATGRFISQRLRPRSPLLQRADTTGLRTVTFALHGGAFATAGPCRRETPPAFPWRTGDRGRCRVPTRRSSLRRPGEWLLLAHGRV